MMSRVHVVCLLVLAFACCAESGCSCSPQHPQQALCDDDTFGEFCKCSWIIYPRYTYTVYLSGCASLLNAFSPKYRYVYKKDNSYL